MRRIEHCNIVKLKYFFYSSGDKVNITIPPDTFETRLEIFFAHDYSWQRNWSMKTFHN